MLESTSTHAMAGPGYNLHVWSTYLTGFEGGGSFSYERRSYFTFDLSDVAETITSASFHIWSPPPLPINNYTGGYRSDRDAETFELHEVLTPVATIEAIPFSTAQTPDVEEVWEDLGEGPVFGSIVMTEVDEPQPDGKWITVNLNTVALQSLNDATGKWILGGIVVEGETPFVSGNWQLFGGASPYYWDEPFRAPMPLLELVTSAASLSGDYNFNGTVDAADYTVWRDMQNSTSNLAADGNGDGIVNIADYVVWAAGFGTSSPPASIPEPTSVALLVITIITAAFQPCNSIIRLA